MIARDAAALDGRVGEVVVVTGRYEAFDQGRYRILGPDGPTPWLCQLALEGGGWLRLGARPEAERARLLGCTVTARGRLILPVAAPPHVAQLEPALTLVEVAIDLPDELPIEDGVPPGLAGERRVVEVVTTHLAMDADRAPELDAPDGVAIIAATPPSVRFYRFLYDAVGAPWHWYDRKRLTDGELAAIVGDPRVEVHVLVERGNPIGYVELDRRVDGACEVAYFGLVPEAIGRGLGRYFLAWAVHAAWRDPALRRLWVHTCTLDGATAIATYQKVGFHEYRHVRHRQYVLTSGAVISS